MSVPITPTICNSSFERCSTPPCDPTSGTLLDDVPQALPFGVDTPVDFNISAATPPTTASSATDEITIGLESVYHVSIGAAYSSSPDEGEVILHLRINGITQSELSFPHQVIAASSTTQQEEVNVLLHVGDTVSASVEQNAGLEGPTLLGAILIAERVCGPATDVIVPQG